MIGLGGKLADWAGDIDLDKFLLAATSPILAAGQAVIADMRETTGSGQPEAGDQLGDAEQRFRQATDVLKSAHPSGDWTGSGSDAYSVADTRQERRTTKLALLDQQLREVIAREAGQITRTRAKLDDESNGLAEFGLTSFGYGLIPGVGPALKQAAELQAVLKALGACSAELQKLAAEVDANAAAGQQLAGQYPSAAEDAGSPGGVLEQGGPYGGSTPSGSGSGAGPGSDPGPRPGSGSGAAGLARAVELGRAGVRVRVADRRRRARQPCRTFPPLRCPNPQRRGPVEARRAGWEACPLGWAGHPLAPAPAGVWPPWWPR